MAIVVGRGFVAVVLDSVRRARSALESMPLEPRGGQVRDQVGLQRLRQEGHPATHKLREEDAALEKRSWCTQGTHRVVVVLKRKMTHHKQMLDYFRDLTQFC
jgi:hypothetical protein